MYKQLVSYGVAAALFAAPAIAGGFDTYNDRTAFEATLGSMIVDGYENSNYDQNGTGSIDIYSDAAMSAILGETEYHTTGFSNLNIIFNQASDPRYCAGCNGSFELIFTSTSVGTADGVFGAGVDIETNSSSLPYHAFVTFGDDTTMDFALPVGVSFFGITSGNLIKSIHFGLANGGTTTSGSFAIDDLTIGNAIPVPGALALLGIAGLTTRRRRR